MPKPKPVNPNYRPLPVPREVSAKTRRELHRRAVEVKEQKRLELMSRQSAGSMCKYLKYRDSFVDRDSERIRKRRKIKILIRKHNGENHGNISAKNVFDRLSSTLEPDQSLGDVIFSRLTKDMNNTEQEYQNITLKVFPQI